MLKNADMMRVFRMIYIVPHTREVVGSSPANPTRESRHESDGFFYVLRNFLAVCPLPVSECPYLQIIDYTDRTDKNSDE